MARPHLLLVDADPRTVRVLEVNLKNDGFSVTTATDGAEALSKMEFTLPDVLVAETRLPRLDGFELVRRLRALPGGERVAVVLVAPESVARGPNGLSPSAADQLRAIELGVSDCLTKPVSVRELVTRVNLMLARRTQAMLTSGGGEQTQFSGHLQDIGVIDLLQSFEAGRRSGVLQVEHGSRTAVILFKHGKVVDAEQGQLRGEEALYRTFLWTTGVFDVEFTNVDVADNIPIGTAALLMEGMRRIDEWGRLAEQLPSSSSVFSVDAEVLLERLAEVPDELNPVLRLFDGERTLLTVIDESPFDDLSTLSVVSKLYFEGVLRVVQGGQGSRLAGMRALGAGAVKAGGNVVKLPDLAESAELVFQARPHAPELTPDLVPRSLVYSEPPQNLRLSQRPPARVAGSTLVGVPVILPSGVRSQGVTNSGTAPSSEEAPAAAAPRDVSLAGSSREQMSPGPAVPEAEFEDVPRRHGGAAPSREIEVPNPSISESTFASASVQQPLKHESPPLAAGAKAKEPLEHDFFAVGDEGTYDGGPSSADAHPELERPSTAEELDVDPRLLAALQARRDRGRRWVTWTVGVALLLLGWGLVTVFGHSPEAEPPVAVRDPAALNVEAPTANVDPREPAPEPEANAEAEAVPGAEVFETVPPPLNGSRVWGGQTPVKPSTGLQPASETPVSPMPRGKKPPTARFPSTPDNQ